ncbi:MAG TPA: hypothetical protein VLL05_02575, partial [Terriglobales bacterium]|nr:hypothetical protein [Terriglobales bacterium]
MLLPYVHGWARNNKGSWDIACVTICNIPKGDIAIFLVAILQKEGAEQWLALDITTSVITMEAPATSTRTNSQSAMYLLLAPTLILVEILPHICSFYEFR